MERLLAFLETLIREHETMVNQGVDWAEESYLLGQISATRKAITLVRGTDSTVPANLIS